MSFVDAIVVLQSDKQCHAMLEFLGDMDIA